MIDMKTIEGKELVLRITGEVQSSNLSEFEKDALEVIENINTDLDTDQDFVEAEQNIKSCNLIEIRIHNARQAALNSTEDIATLITTTERLEAKFRETRLGLNKKVKTEKGRRKSEIINKAMGQFADLIYNSDVKHAFTLNTEAFNNAVKNKRSLEAMQKAVDEVVESEKTLLYELGKTFSTNLIDIKQAEVNYPGLFPDKKNLAVSSHEVVAAQIESRISTFKYKQEMKEKAEREKAEEAEKFKQEMKDLAVSSHEVVQEYVSPEKDISTPSFIMPPLPPTTPTHELTVLVVSANIQAVVDKINSIDGVTVVDQ